MEHEHQKLLLRQLNEHDKETDMVNRAHERRLYDQLKLMKKQIKGAEKETNQLQKDLEDIQQKLQKKKEQTFIAKMHLEQDVKNAIDAMYRAHNIL